MTLSGKKILVTGVTGAVALPLARYLARDNEVWGVARFTDPTTLQSVESAGITTIAHDIASGGLQDLPDDFDYVLHLAYFRGGNNAFDEAFRVNGEGTGLVLQHCRRATAALVMSSHVVYTPVDDPSHRYAEDEPVGGMRSPWAPTSSTSKIAQEAVARFCARAFDLPVTLARLNTVYGPDRRYLPVSNGTAILAGQEVFVRGEPCPHTPIHVDDMAWQIEPLLDAATVPATVVNWCGDVDVTAHDWCTAAAQLGAVEPRVTVRTVPGAPCNNAADPARRQAVTGPCRVTFDDAYSRALLAVAADGQP